MEDFHHLDAKLAGSVLVQVGTIVESHESGSGLHRRAQDDGGRNARGRSGSKQEGIRLNHAEHSLQNPDKDLLARTEKLSLSNARPNTDLVDMSRNGRGLTKGIGFTNGSGLTVGNGLVNGLGMTDGLGSGQIPPSKSRSLAMVPDKTNGQAENASKGLHTRVDLINGFSVKGAPMDVRIKPRRRLSRKKRKAIRSLEKRASEPLPCPEIPRRAQVSSNGSVSDTGTIAETYCLPTASSGLNECDGGESDSRARDGEVHC